MSPVKPNDDDEEEIIRLSDPASRIQGTPNDPSSPNLIQPTLPLLCQPENPSFIATVKTSGDDEEIIRLSDPASCIQGTWDGPSSPNLSVKMIPREPILGPESSEMLLMRFDRQTCGILSVKDGISENPWRTLVWPLAMDSPALYHAICSLAAFHSSKENPDLKIHGMDHMRRSIRSLARGIGSMRTDAALATTLALAFAESWDRHISTGIQHLRGAKVLVNQAMANQQHSIIHGNDTSRLRFLYNTWVYMDVIARLTSLEECGLDEISRPPATAYVSVHQVDPLMGCATTLFPLISQVANLVQRVRKTKTNSIAIISQALELKTAIEEWDAPKYFEPPEDPTSDVQHSFQTAQAYRWATLLYLHQAVPEIPSESAAELAKRVLVLLATVPLTSRTTIIHIFPLLAASCEVDNEEDRIWVRERWAAMQSRLMIGNIDRCLEVIHEVWERRDMFNLTNVTNQQVSFVAPVDTMRRRSNANPGNSKPFSHSEEQDWFGVICSNALQQIKLAGVTDLQGMMQIPPLSPVSIALPMSPSRGSLGPGLEHVEFEKTVRGRLHWVSVMKDWNWEGTCSYSCAKVYLFTEMWHFALSWRKNTDS